MNTQTIPQIANVVMTTVTGDIITMSGTFLMDLFKSNAFHAVDEYIKRENEIVRIKEDGDVEYTTPEAAAYLGYVPEYMTKFAKDYSVPYRKGKPNVYLKRDLDIAKDKKQTRRRGSKG